MKSITDPAGGKTTLTYDKLWNVTSMTDPTGATVLCEYDQFNRIIKATDQEGHNTTYTHDNNGNVTTVTNSMGATTTINYDALNRPVSIINPLKSITRQTYDQVGNITTEIDPLGNITQYEYDQANQLTKVIDPLGNTTALTYSILGQIETITNAADHTTTYSYYPGGRLKSITYPEGEIEIYSYDKNSNLQTVTKGDATTTIVYDSLNRVITSTNTLGYSKHYTYDPIGNVTSTTDENGNTTHYTYDQLSNLVKATDAAGHHTNYTYNQLKQLTALTQYNVDGNPQVTTYERNKKGEIIKTTNPLNLSVTYSYDPMGNMIMKLDEDSNQTLYTYNLASQLQNITYADGKSVSFKYNALNQLTQMQDWLGTTTIELDPLGRATKVTSHDNQVVGYNYNNLGQRDKLTYPNGETATYTYTPSGRLETVTATAGITHYAYDNQGRVTTRTLPDHTTTAYTFNQLDQLTNLVHSQESILDQFQYTYDPAGNITQIIKHRPDVPSDHGVFNYAYDKLNRLTQTIAPIIQTNYTYDPLGNRLSLSQLENGVTTTTDNTYNARNQLLTSTTNAVTTCYTYDLRGNLIQTRQNDLTPHETYTFDATNMLAVATTSKGTAHYTYNGLYNRTSLTEYAIDPATNAVPSTPTSTLNYTTDQILQYDNLLTITGTHSQNFIWGNNLLSSTPHNHSALCSTHYLQDHLNTPTRVLQASDTEPLSYNEFGITHHPTITNTQNPFIFTSYQSDNITNLQYAQARYYNPLTSTFISEDPIKDQLNWYGYCSNAPLNYIDPLGLRVYTVPGRTESIRENGRHIGEVLYEIDLYTIYIRTGTHDQATRNIFSFIPVVSLTNYIKSSAAWALGYRSINFEHAANNLENALNVLLHYTGVANDWSAVPAVIAELSPTSILGSAASKMKFSISGTIIGSIITAASTTNTYVAQSDIRDIERFLGALTDSQGFFLRSSMRAPTRELAGQNYVFVVSELLRLSNEGRFNPNTNHLRNEDFNSIRLGLILIGLANGTEINLLKHIHGFDMVSSLMCGNMEC